MQIQDNFCKIQVPVALMKLSEKYSEANTGERKH